MLKNFWNYFLSSIRLPQKQAVFNLNRIGMDTTVLYMFLLIGIASIPGLLEQIGKNKTDVFYMEPFFYLIFFFIFYYLILVVAIFTLLSFVAYVTTRLATLLHRKLRYAIMWKMAASATTIPLLLYTIISFFYPLTNYFLFFVVVYFIFTQVKIITIYPRRKKASK